MMIGHLMMDGIEGSAEGKEMVPDASEHVCIHLNGVLRSRDPLLKRREKLIDEPPFQCPMLFSVFSKPIGSFEKRGEVGFPGVV